MEITFDINLNGKLRLLYEKRRYGTKGKPKETVDGVKYQLYECAMERQCHASLSMVLNEQYNLVEPLHFRKRNPVHHKDCKQLNEKELDIDRLIREVKKAVVEDQGSSIQLIYEIHRTMAVRNGSPIVYPDFHRIKHRIGRKQNKHLQFGARKFKDDGYGKRCF